MFKKYSVQIACIILIIVWFVVAVFFMVSESKRDIVKYDCSIAEISPDFPVEVKNACRKKLSGRI